MKQAVELLGTLGSFKHSPSDSLYGLKSVWLGLEKLWFMLEFMPYVGQV